MAKRSLPTVTSDCLELLDNDNRSSGKSLPQPIPLIGGRGRGDFPANFPPSTEDQGQSRRLGPVGEFGQQRGAAPGRDDAQGIADHLLRRQVFSAACEERSQGMPDSFGSKASRSQIPA